MGLRVSLAEVVMMVHDGNDVALRVAPRLPESGEGEGLAALHDDSHGSLLLAESLPLVKAVGEDEASASSQGIAE